MKNWKKWLAVLLSVAMLVSLLAACGGDSESEEEEDDEKVEDKKDDEKDETKGDGKDETKPDGTKPSGDATQPQATEPQATEPQATEPEPTNPPAKEYLDVIPNGCTVEDMKAMDVLHVEAKDSYGSENINYIWAFEKESSDAGVLYYKESFKIEGEDFVNELVYEYNGDTVVAYERDESGAFVISDNDYEIYDVEMAFDEMYESLAVPGEAVEGMQFCVTDKSNVKPVIKDVTVYEMYYEGELGGYVCIDNETGLIAYGTSVEDDYEVVVTKIDTTDAGIPAYK